MKRAILINAREGELKESKEKCVYAVFAVMPSKMKNGGLWYPRNTELLKTACIRKSRSEEEFNRFKDMTPGAICDLTFGVNDFDGKTFIARIDVVTESPFTTADLYV